MAVRKRTEFTVACPHKPGELAHILEALSKAGVNVLAFCGYGQGSGANLMMVLDDEAKAEGTLGSIGLSFQKNEVVAVTTESGAGQGAALARKLSDAGINMEYAYATTSGSGESTFVLATSDVAKAVEVLG